MKILSWSIWPNSRRQALDLRYSWLKFGTVSAIRKNKTLTYHLPPTTYHPSASYHLPKNNWTINSPGLAQGVSDHQQCALDLYSCHWFENLFETFAIEADPSSMFGPFFGKQAMETNSNNIVNSNCCFLFEKCAREVDPGGGLVCNFHVRAPIFLQSHFRNCFSEK